MSEDVPCPDPNEVVTRAILREELQEELAKHTKANQEALLAQEHRLLDDLARHSNANQESLLANMRLMFERYNDHPGRIAGHDERIDDHENRIVRLELQPASQPRTRRRTRTRAVRKPKRSRR